MTMSLAASAQKGGTDGFFSWNDANNEINRDPVTPDFVLPSYHGTEDNTEAPLGSGLLVLTALGAGYAVARKRKK